MTPLVHFPQVVGVSDCPFIDKIQDKYKKIGNRRSLTCNILMRIQMTDEHVLRWVHKTLKVGTIRKKNRSPSIKSHWKDSWIYSVRYRQAYDVCKLLWPYAKVKLHKIEQIIDHYEPDHIMDGKIIDLQGYKEAMSLE